MVLTDGRTPTQILAQELADEGIEYLTKAVHLILLEAKQANKCLLPKEISERLGIAPIQTDASRTPYLIVNSILCALEKEGHVQRCQNNRRTWELSPIEITDE